MKLLPKLIGVPFEASPLLIDFRLVPQRLSIHRRTLEREIVRGRFPLPLKIGRKSVVRVSDIDDYVKLLESERDQKQRGLRSEVQP